MKQNALTNAVAACFDAADHGAKVADTVAACFAGVPAAKRDEVKSALYDAIRKADGRDEKGKLRTARELSDRTRRAYEAARQAVRRLFDSSKGGKKKKKSGKAIVVPLDRKGISAMVKAATAAIQKAENLPYSADKAIAAWLALAEVCGVQPKQK
jgi:hypothetical protein